MDEGTGGPRKAPAKINISVVVFAVVVATLAATILTLMYLERSARRDDEDWIREVRFAAIAAPNPGSEAFLEVLDKTDWRALADMRPLLRDAESGKLPPTEPSIADAIARHRSVIAAAGRIRVVPPFPSVAEAGLSLASPDYDSMADLFCLMAANVRRLEAAGEFDEAALRAADLHRFGGLFLRSGDEATLLLHLIGIAAQEMATSALQRLWQSIPPQAQRDVRAALDERAHFRPSILGAIQAEAERYRRVIESARGNESSLAVALQGFDPSLDPAGSMALAKSLEAASLSFADEHRRLWDEAMKQLRAGNTAIDRGWFGERTGNQLVLRGLVEPGKLLRREQELLARAATLQP